MSSAAAAGALFGADDRVYRAVAADGSVEEVRRAIERSRSSAAVNQPGRDGETPLAAARRMHRWDLLRFLLENGAEAGDDDWYKAVFWCVDDNDLAGLRRLIERGVSVDTASTNVLTPLMEACGYQNDTPDRRDVTLEVFRLSSAETRRAVFYGTSAIDYMIAVHGELPLAPWRIQLIGELLAAGAPVLPEYRARALPIAAAHAARREAELAACESIAHDWRAHETFVGLSLDVRELREAEQMVAVRRARLVALELELCALGAAGSDESESESESDESDRSESSGDDSEEESEG